jgi:cytochrome c oxidase cbb3-type subunit 3
MSDPHSAPDDATLPEHDYDGIREEDNPMPSWWVGVLWVAILFTVVYVPVVHVFNILPQHQLQASLTRAARAQEQRELALEASGALDKDPVAAGEKYFRTFCVTCHGPHAEGGIGPNLTDAYWIHGPSEDSIRATIANGVSAKGMPTWGPILGDRKIKMLAAYVASLSQNPQPGKKAEGEKYDMLSVRRAAPDSAKVRI